MPRRAAAFDLKTDEACSELICLMRKIFAGEDSGPAPPAHMLKPGPIGARLRYEGIRAVAYDTEHFSSRRVTIRELTQLRALRRASRQTWGCRNRWGTRPGYTPANATEPINALIARTLGPDNLGLKMPRNMNWNSCATDLDGRWTLSPNALIASGEEATDISRSFEPLMMREVLRRCEK